MRVKLLLTVALLISLSANAVLWRRGPAARDGGAPRAGPLPARAAELPPSAAGERPLPMARLPLPPAPSTAQDCQQMVAHLEAELAKMQKEHRRMPTAEQFKVGQPNPALERLLRPEFERILGSDNPKRSHTLECRGDLCRVEVMSARDDSDWSRQLQSDPAFRKYVDGAAFKGNAPTSDPFTGEWLAHHEVLLKIGDPNRADGMELLTELLHRFEAAGIVRDCGSRFDEKGELDVQLSLNEDGAISVAAGGPLAPRQAGRCIADHLRAAAAATPVRLPVRGAVLNKTFVL